MAGLFRLALDLCQRIPCFRHPAIEWQEVQSLWTLLDYQYIRHLPPVIKSSPSVLMLGEVASGILALADFARCSPLTWLDENFDSLPKGVYLERTVLPLRILWDGEKVTDMLLNVYFINDTKVAGKAPLSSLKFPAPPRTNFHLQVNPFYSLKMVVLVYLNSDLDSWSRALKWYEAMQPHFNDLMHPPILYLVEAFILEPYQMSDKQKAVNAEFQREVASFMRTHVCLREFLHLPSGDAVQMTWRRIALLIAIKSEFPEYNGG